MKRLLIVVVCGVCVASLLGVAAAQFARTEDAVRYRQSTMFLIGQHFGRIGEVVQGRKDFEPAAVAKNADLVATFARLPWDAFMVPGSDSGTQMRGAALSDSDGFKAAAANSEKETAKLAEVAAAGNLDAIRAQFGVVGQSCKACHDKYRGR
ncbi:MAG: cytochrome c [Desulfatitalea sp.]|nr:cytochrome c [Desulfatitalea sp.]